LLGRIIAHLSQPSQKEKQMDNVNVNAARMEMGWYCIQNTLLGCIAGHTFAAIQGDDGPWFDCYGGHNGPKLKTIRSNKVISRRLAVTICCLNPDDPRGNTQAEFNKKPGDNSGIAYGVTGVCHQMANRILWESGLITSAPGYPATYLTYGTFGTGWLGYLGTCKARAGISCTTPDYTGLDKEMVDNESEFAETGDDKLYENRLRLLIKGRLGADYPENNITKLTKILLGFVENKRINDGKHIDNIIKPIEHASTVNELHIKTLDSMNNIIGDKDFQELFGCNAQDKPQLIVPEIALELSLGGS
jgi:hypothetical protein